MLLKCSLSFLFFFALQGKSFAQVCEYYNYTNTNGSKTVHTLAPNAVASRKIIDRNSGTTSLINQEIGCKDGQLFEVSNQLYQNTSGYCHYHDYINTIGTKITKQLKHGVVATRQIIAQQSGQSILMPQNISCHEGKLIELDSNLNGTGRKVYINGVLQQASIRTIKVVDLGTVRQLYFNGILQNVPVRKITFNGGTTIMIVTQ